MLFPGSSGLRPPAKRAGTSLRLPRGKGKESMVFECAGPDSRWSGFPPARSAVTGCPSGTTGGTMWSMANADKMIRRMKDNPRDWRIEDLMVVAKDREMTTRQKGSHVSFVSKDGQVTVVPRKLPINPIYIRKFLELLGEQK